VTAPLRVGIIRCGNAALDYHLPAYLTLRDRFEVHVSGVVIVPGTDCSGLSRRG
jgi:predicted dehydrogenase